MEIPDPAPEMVITLPKRGKIRVTSIEEADALIIAATRAKSMLITLLAFEPAEFDAREPLPQRTPGSTLADDEADDDYLCAAGGPNGDPDLRCSLAYGHKGDHAASGETWPWTGDEEIGQYRSDVAAGADPFAIPANRIGDAAPLPVPCPEHHPATSAPCARLSGHPLPHKPLHGSEWGGEPEEPDDGPEPYHATSGPQCGEKDDGFTCTAQRGHGGPRHIAYDTLGTERHRWPVADDYHPSRWLAPAQPLVSDATIAHVQAVMDATCADPACSLDYPHDKHAPVTVADKNGAAT